MGFEENEFRGEKITEFHGNFTDGFWAFVFWGSSIVVVDFLIFLIFCRDFQKVVPFFSFAVLCGCQFYERFVVFVEYEAKTIDFTVLLFFVEYEAKTIDVTKQKT